MDAVVQILISGATLGAMYALSAIGLALVWGALGMLNMAHGAIIGIGAYASFTAVNQLGLPWFLGLPSAMIVSLFAGIVLYYVCVRWLYMRETFEIAIIIATVSVAIVIENLVIKIYTAYPKKQPFFVDGGVHIGSVSLQYQTIVIIVVSLALMLLLWWLLRFTYIGRSIRATAQNRDAAQLLGVPVGRAFIQVMCVNGVVAAVAGVLLTSIIPMSPTVGYDPMLKAFIVCAVAGLGNVPGSVYAAFALGVFEAAVQYLLGASYGFPAMLGLVIVALIWRPYGVFGRRAVERI
jgi:branched-chain amino acid transport system permease protein